MNDKDKEKNNENNNFESDFSEENIKNLGSTCIKNSRGNVQCLTIVGQIEGHMLLSPQTKTTKYEHILPLLVSVEEDENIDGLIVILNTVGGDVEAGLAISEMIAGMKKPSVSLVLGGGHSIGVPLAVSAKKSYIVPSASMTIHPIRMSGTLIGVPQTYEYFNKMQDRVVNFVVNNSHIEKEKFIELMMRTGEIANDVGCIVIGNEAVEIGLIDEIGGIDKALECLYGQIEDIKRNGEDTKSDTKNRDNGENGDNG